MLLATQLLPITNYLTYGPSDITYGNNVYDNLERQGTAGNYQGSKEPWVAKKQVESAVKYGNYDSLPDNAKHTYENYTSNGWKGNYNGQAIGTKAGKAYRNKNSLLPKTDSVGNKITYREFDINAPAVNGERDSERFVVGSDGSIYYTDSHYGDGVSPKGLPPFIRIR